MGIPGIVGIPVLKSEFTFTPEQCDKLVTRTGYAVLGHLCETAVRQKVEARATKRKFRGGWTYMRYNRHVRLATVRALKRLGLVEFCCDGHAGTDLVRISRKGIEFIERREGMEIMV